MTQGGMREGRPTFEELMMSMRFVSGVNPKQVLKERATRTTDCIDKREKSDHIF